MKIDSELLEKFPHIRIFVKEVLKVVLENTKNNKEIAMIDIFRKTEVESQTVKKILNRAEELKIIKSEMRANRRYFSRVRK